MNNVINLPISASGDPIPVFDSDSRKTEIINCGATPNTVVVQSKTMNPASLVMPYLILGGSGDETFTVTSLRPGYDGEKLSITVAGAGTEGIAITGNDITITPKAGGSKLEALQAMIAAHPVISQLIAITGTSTDATIDASQAKDYLGGYSPGNCGILVRIYADADAFYGKAQAATRGTPAAQIPITAKMDYTDVLYAGDLICAKSSTANAKVYITPARRY